MYPCINYNNCFGTAIKGLIDPEGITKPLSLFVNVLKEPNIRDGKEPVAMFGTIKVTGLDEGKNYIIYRYDDYKNWPKDSTFVGTNFTKSWEFTADFYAY